MNKDKVKRLPDQVSLRSTRPAMTNTVGRSMVEMLGVLAIIGVLSAGALAGYSKAMFRHRVNQSIDIFSQVLQRFSELEEKGIGEGVVIGVDGNGTAIDAVKYGLIPDCVEEINVYGESDCKLPIGSLSMDFCDRCDAYKDIGGIVGWFRFNFNDAKSCVAFSSAGWDKAIPVDWLNPYGFVEIDENAHYDIERNTMTLENITQSCESRCQSRESCSLYITIHSDY